MIGYRAFAPGTTRVVNHLTWPADLDPVAVAAGRRPCSSGSPRPGSPPPWSARPPSRGQASPAPRCAARPTSARRPCDARVDAAVAALAASPRAVVNVYWGDIDKTGHARGWLSHEWAIAAGAGRRRAAGAAPPRPAGRPRRGDRRPRDGRLHRPRRCSTSRTTRTCAPTCSATAGEPRLVQLRVRPGRADAVAARWRDVLGERAWVLTCDEALAAGWFGARRRRPALMARVGEVLVAARGRPGRGRHRARRPGRAVHGGPARLAHRRRDRRAAAAAGAGRTGPGSVAVMAELVFFCGTMDSGKSTLALQVDHTRTARGLVGLLFTRRDRAGDGPAEQPAGPGAARHRGRRGRRPVAGGGRGAAGRAAHRLPGVRRGAVLHPGPGGPAGPGGRRARGRRVRLRHHQRLPRPAVPRARSASSSSPTGSRPCRSRRCAGAAPGGPTTPGRWPGGWWWTATRWWSATSPAPTAARTRRRRRGRGLRGAVPPPLHAPDDRLGRAGPRSCRPTCCPGRWTSARSTPSPSWPSCRRARWTSARPRAAPAPERGPGSPERPPGRRGERAAAQPSSRLAPKTISSQLGTAARRRRPRRSPAAAAGWASRGRGLRGRPGALRAAAPGSPRTPLRRARRPGGGVVELELGEQVGLDAQLAACSRARPPGRPAATTRRPAGRSARPATDRGRRQARRRSGTRRRSARSGRRRRTRPTRARLLSARSPPGTRLPGVRCRGVAAPAGPAARPRRRPSRRGG